MQSGEGQSAYYPFLTTGSSSHQNRRAFFVFSSLHPQSASLAGEHSQNGTTRSVPANALLAASSVSEWPKLAPSKFHFATAASNVIDNYSIYEQFISLSLLEHCVLSLWAPAYDTSNALR